MESHVERFICSLQIPSTLTLQSGFTANEEQWNTFKIDIPSNLQFTAVAHVVLFPLMLRSYVGLLNFDMDFALALPILDVFIVIYIAHRLFKKILHVYNK